MGGGEEAPGDTRLKTHALRHEGGSSDLGSCLPACGEAGARPSGDSPESEGSYGLSSTGQLGRLQGVSLENNWAQHRGASAGLGGPRGPGSPEWDRTRPFV